MVLFIGKLEPKKKPLDALYGVAALGTQASLLVVGAGELEGDLRTAAAKTGTKLHYAGFLNQSEVSRAYVAADCLVLPSGWGETWGLVVNEALATGLPCALSDHVGCAPDLVVPGQTGEISRAGDISSLASALRSVRQWAGEPETFSRCQRHADRYSFGASTMGLLAACDYLQPRVSLRIDEVAAANSVMRVQQ